MSKVYVVRQPIFDDRNEVVAYELLFHRPSGGDAASDREMTSQVIANSIVNIGLGELTGNKPAYINFSRDLLMDNTALLLPPDRVGIEVLETVEIDDALLAELRQLKAKGYSIALDDFEYDESKRELVALADRIKVDVLNNPDVASTVKILRQFPVALLAEKVETHEQYAQMAQLGFTLFQGYFFCKPQAVAGMRLPDSKLAVMRALKEVSTAESTDQLSGVIGHDVNLSYKLLRYINSAAFGFRIKIESIEQALNLLGLETTRRWLTVLSMAMLGEDKPLELVRQAMLRGRLMEDLARLRGLDRLPDYFVLGMFSLLDALIDQPLETAVQEIALPEIVRQGLFDAKSGPARMLMLLRDIERADWRAMAFGCRLLGLDADAVMAAQGEAAKWLEEYSAMLSET